MTLAFLGISKIRKKAAEEKEKGAKSYVGKLGVSNIYGGSAQAGISIMRCRLRGDGVREEGTVPTHSEYVISDLTITRI